MNDLLTQIESLQETQTNAEISVLESLIGSYEKSIMILENCDESMDLSSFDIFQEGEKWDKFKDGAKAPVFGNKGESVVKRILMILPRLLQKLIALIRKMVTSETVQRKKMDKDIQDLESIANDSVSESSVIEIYDTDMIMESSRTQSAVRRQSVADSDNWSVLVDFNTAIDQAAKLYMDKNLKSLCNDINKCDTSKASMFGKLQEDDPLLDECERLKSQLQRITTKAEPIATSFEKETQSITQTLTNRVVNEVTKYAGDRNINQSRKDFISKNVRYVKQIRDSINELHEQRKSVMTCISDMSDDMSKALSEGYRFQSNNAHSGAAVEFVMIAYNVSKMLNLIVTSSYGLNQTVSNSWNAMIRVMKG